MSEDGRSVANSEGSGTTVGGTRRRRRSTRTSTTFCIAHPAPTLTQKQRLVQIRPKLLLQLQRLSPDSRHKPAVDVLPSTVVVPRLQKRFPRMFRGKGELGCNDVMVVKSEDYDSPYDTHIEDTDSDEEGLANRDLLAVICQMPKDKGGSEGKAEIVLSDGSVWLASPMPNGSFDFTTTDERGYKTTARWVRKSTKCKGGDVSEPGFVDNDTKFNFSIIDPNSRRHPIMATLNQSKLDIPDHYTTVSASSGRFPPTSPIRNLPYGVYDDSSANEETPAERTTHPIDENVKNLIQVTGIWVALRQSWSPYFKYNDAMTLAPTSTNSQNLGRVRSNSNTLDSGRPSPVVTAGSTPESSHGNLGGVIASKIRRVSAKGPPSNSNSTQYDSIAAPKRSVSTGAQFMQRVAARRVGIPPSTVLSDSDGESPLGPPRRAVTENIHGSSSNRLSTPPASLTLPSSGATTPDTPTRPHRRVQSVYVPTSTLQHSFTNLHPEEADFLYPNTTQAQEAGEKIKISRWRQFTNIFRRSSSSGRSE